MRIRSKALATVAAAVLGVAGAHGALAQNFEPASLRVIGPSANTPGWDVTFGPYWLKWVPEQTGGKVTTSAHPMSELGLKGPEIFRLAKLGVSDFVATTLAYTAGEIPENDGMDLAGVVQDLDTLQKVVDAYLPYLKTLYEQRAGVIPLVVWPTVSQVIWCATPINGIDDLKGKKVRAMGATVAEFLEGAGALPVTMTFAEVVPALQRKVVDCAVTGTASGNISKWFEVSTHFYPLNVGWSLYLQAANKQSWSRLGPNTRKFLDETGRSMLAKSGWDLARIGDDHGIWCSTGDSRCDPSVTAPRPLTKASMKLVPLTKEDDAKRVRIVRETVLPKFARRCGKPCIDKWNETAGKVLGLEAKMM